MLKLQIRGGFKKDYKLAIKRGLDWSLAEEVIQMLREGKTLPEKYRDHSLRHFMKRNDVRECHVQPDWLLVYSIHDDVLTLELIRTGTHSDIF